MTESKIGAALPIGIIDPTLQSAAAGIQIDITHIKQEILGEKIRFAGKSEAVAELVTNLDSLAELSLNEVSLNAQATSLAAAVISEGTVEEKRRHTLFIARGDVHVDEGPDRPTMVHLGPQHKDAVNEKLAEVTVNDSDIATAAEEATERHLDVDGIVQQLLAKLQREVFQLAEQIPGDSFVLMKEEEVAINSLSEAFSELKNNGVNVVGPFKRVEAEASKEIAAKISRTAIRINNRLREVIDDPEAFVAQAFVVENRELLLKAGKGAYSAAAAKVMTPFVRSIKEQAAAAKIVQAEHEEEVPTAEVPTVTRPPKKGKKDRSTQAKQEVLTKEGIVRINNQTVTLPWLNGGSETTLAARKIITNEGITIILRTIAPGKLEKISSTSRRNFRKSGVRRNALDDMIRLEATAIARGVVPMTEGSPRVKRIRHIDPASPYAGNNVWFPPKSNNKDPRLFFILSTAGEILDKKLNPTNDIDPETNVMLVVGESDSASELDVLETITHRPRSSFANQKDGSLHS